VIQQLKREATWPLLVVLLWLPATVTFAQDVAPRLGRMPPILLVSSSDAESPAETAARPELRAVSRPVSKRGRRVAIAVGSVLGTVLLLGAGALIGLRAAASRIDATPDRF